MKTINSEQLNINDFKCLWDNVIVKPIKIEEKGQFVRHQGEEDKSELGEVLKVPEALKEFSVGDVVLFNKYSTTQTDIGDELIVRSEDIVAVKKKNA